MSKQFSLKFLQIWHLTFALAIPILYSTLKLGSEAQDELPHLLGNMLLVGVCAWGGYIFVLTIIHGKKEVASSNVLEFYRGQLLCNVRFLWLSNIMLTLATAFLTYQIFFFRQVEFLADSDIRISIVDAPGEVYVLGVVKGNQPTKYRIRVGTRHIAYTDLLESKSPVALDPVNISSWWSNKQTPNVIIKVDTSKYEQTNPIR